MLITKTVKVTRALAAAASNTWARSNNMAQIVVERAGLLERAFAGHMAPTKIAKTFDTRSVFEYKATIKFTFFLLYKATNTKRGKINYVFLVRCTPRELQWININYQAQQTLHAAVVSHPKQEEWHAHAFTSPANEEFTT